ncbi:homeobox protein LUMINIDEPENDENS isoform X2 [Mercurialis annua]|uniref:homeobox protein LUMINIDEPENDENS isoform X2 n=1 Tax=Mercurialis annua TaxID=3986 RepID=UPI00215FE03B|nr:homeobox protein LUMINIDEPENDENS isoform X2 [Mercurialis annua]
MMENLEEKKIGTSVESFQKFLDSQKELFHGQIDQLQRIVVTQCQLTGVNPLSQEMAAGAMSIKIGKRPRDLLNPKAIKYMQSVFSMKDAISKKESREISAQFGITVTQVRDFFNSQRTRVRKLVRLSREKAARANVHIESHDGAPTSSDPMMPIDLAPLISLHPDPVPLNFAGSCSAPLSSVSSNPAPVNYISSNPAPLNAVCSNLIPTNTVESNPAPLNVLNSNQSPLNSIGSNPAAVNYVAPNPAPLNFAGPSNLEEAPSCSTQDDILSGLDDADKFFVENIFSLLRKEETFSGQEMLMERILQIQNPQVLNWFLTKGGVMILATWLGQAADEEQTSMLLVTLKVLCHLPLHKAVPEHMSAILQSVNGLRFYRTSDISNRARVLLSRWSKMFARAQAMKKPNGIQSSMDAQEMILKQSIDEIMGNDSWQHNDALALSESSENIRKMEPSQTLKLLPSSTDDSSRKHVLGASSSYNRERRKVQLVEQPGQKAGGRSPLATKAVPASQGRPMSTDDIQKAKMRALFMQSKYGKTGSSSNGINGVKTVLTRPLSTPSNVSLASKVPFLPKIEENKKSVVASLNILSKQEASLNVLSKQEAPLNVLSKQEAPLNISSKQEALLNISSKQEALLNISSKQEALLNISSKQEALIVTKHKLDLKEPLGDLCKRVRIPWKRPPEIKLDDVWRVGIGENSKEVDVQKNRNRREIETIYRTVHEIPSNPKAPWDLEMDYDDTLTPDIPIEQPPDAEIAESQASPHEPIVKTAVTSVPVLPQINAAIPDLELLAVLLKNPELVFALTSGHAGNIAPQDTVKLLDMIKRSGGGLADSVNGHSGKVDMDEVSLPSPTPPTNPGTAGWRHEPVKNPFSQQNSRGKKVAYTDATIPTTIPSIQPQNLDNAIRISQQHAIVHENAQSSSVMFSSHHNISTNSSILQMQTKNFATSNQRMRVETENYVKTVQPLPYAVNTADRRVSIAPTQSHHQTHLIPETTHLHSSRQSGNTGSMPESWRNSRVSNSASQVNYQTNYEFRGAVQPQVRERNGYNTSNDGFESWSPENSPSRSPQYMSGRNYQGPRTTNPGRNYNSDNRGGPRNYNSGHQDQTRNSNKRWR